MKQLRLFSLAMLALFFITIGCNNSQQSSGQEEQTKQEAQDKKKTDKNTPELTKQWATDSIMKTPESVCYNPKKDVMYVSNIQGKSNAKDGKGFISLVTPEGEVKNLKWVTGLDAPKGMGIYEDTLYVTNVDEIVAIDIEKSKIANRYPCKNAKFANDIAINNKGVVFASDMNADRIYRLKDDNAENWLDIDKLDSPNGLFTLENNLLIGMSNSVLKVDYSGENVETLITNTGGIDGLEAAHKNYYLKSDWRGHVHLIHPDKEKQLILDTTPENINAADIDYVPGKKLLLVPTFNDNRVMAYKLNM